MRYLLNKLGDAELPTVSFDGTTMHGHIYEVACHPLIPIREIKPGGVLEQVRSVVERAQFAMSATIYRNAKELEQAHPEAEFIVILVQQEPVCIAAERPATPIYDPPSYWDDNLGEIVVPVGAKVTGHTEAAVGWVFKTRLALIAAPKLPDGFRPEDVSEEFPFWVAAPRVPADVMAYFQSPKGQAKLALHLGVSLGYGPAPMGAQTPTQFNKIVQE